MQFYSINGTGIDKAQPLSEELLVFDGHLRKNNHSFFTVGYLQDAYGSVHSSTPVYTLKVSNTKSSW